MRRCCPRHDQELVPNPGADLLEYLDGEPAEEHLRFRCPTPGCVFTAGPITMGEGETPEPPAQPTSSLLLEEEPHASSDDPSCGAWSWSEAPAPARPRTGPPPASVAAKQAGPRLADCTVVEEAYVSGGGGGFVNETWLVQVNDDWLTISQLLRRGGVGDIRAELVEGHDPNGGESSGRLPPQTSFHRVTHVVAPAGTLFSKRVDRPVVQREKTLHEFLSTGEIYVRRKTQERRFVLRGPERLVALDLDAERSSRPRPPVRERMSGEQTRRYASAILSLLDDDRDGGAAAS